MVAPTNPPETTKDIIDGLRLDITPCVPLRTGKEKCGYKKTEIVSNQFPEVILSARDTSVVLVENQKLLTHVGWFSPHLTHESARKLLRKTPAGSFLLRHSSDKDFLYAITVRVRRGQPATSVRVTFKDNYFSLEAVSPRHAKHIPQFNSLHELVQYYATENRRRPESERCCYSSSVSKTNKVIELQRPVLTRISNLTHLCRLAWNRAEGQTLLNKTLNMTIPPRIKSYLQEYPYKF